LKFNSITTPTTAESAFLDRFAVKAAISLYRSSPWESLDQAEDHLIFAAVTDAGEPWMKKLRVVFSPCLATQDNLS